jgi:hypothetical protein
VPTVALDVIGRAKFTDKVTCDSLSIARDGIPVSLANINDQGGIIQCQAGALAAASGYWGSLVGQPFIVWEKTGTDIRFYVADSTSGVYAWAYNSLSDESLKTDWSELPEDFLEKLSAVKSGEYTLIETGERNIGVGAQSLQSVLPHAVKNGIGGKLSVSYGNAALVACVRLAQELQALRAEVNSLKGS